ncbi:MAG: hypothetical protein A4S14_00275 [Proteobacteria bacterium SG_bin9]|nr:MAG: hypothetical protein A4S14_00275 [Proteobacteria bacterium SG_bin9]
MPTASLDTVIRQLAKQQHKSLMAAAKAGRDHYLALAAKVKDAAGKARFKAMAKHAMDEGMAAARRLQMSADNTADSFARAMRRLGEEAEAEALKLAEKAKAAAAKKKPAKKAAKKAKA